MNERAFDRVLIFMFENQYRSYVMRNQYFLALAQQGIDLANCFGVMHPSQTNYIASIAGELCNVTSDSAPEPLAQRTVVDLVEESSQGLGWKAYMDSYIPQNNRWQAEGFAPKDEYPYVIKHNPFSSFANIQRNPARWKRIVSEAELFADLLNGTLPEYAWFTPNMWNDGHYTDGTQSEPAERAPALVDQAAVWLEGFFGDLLFPGPQSHLPEGTLVVVTFDEADFEADWDQGKKYTYDGPNQIYTVLLGDGLEPGVQEEGCNHYSLLRTVEENFALGSLGKNDAHANWFQFLWGREFGWGEASEIDITGATEVAATGCGSGADQLVVWRGSHGDSNGNGEAGGNGPSAASELRWARLDAEGTLSPRGGEVFGAAAGASQARLAFCGDRVIAVFLDGRGRPHGASYTQSGGWEFADQPLVDAAWSDLTLANFGEQNERVMLVGRQASDPSGPSDRSGPSDAGATAITSLEYDGTNWQKNAVDVGHTGVGDVALGALGPSLYLVFESGGGALSAVSYNAAEYNVVSVPDGKYGGSYDDTTQGVWSPSAFHVAHFGSSPSPRTPAEDEPTKEAYRGRAPLLVGSLDGVLHLLHPGESNQTLLEETFSIAGVMTAKLPISYSKGDAGTTSNGYGTLAQAGWSTQREVPAALLAPGSVACLAQGDEELVLLFQEERGGSLRAMRGGYQRR